MAWEISMSSEGWEMARERLEERTKEQLIQAIIDDLYEAIEAELYGESGVSGERSIDLILEMLEPYEQYLKKWPSHDALVDQAFALIERHNTCDNGGHSLWIDRAGIHKVYIGDKKVSDVSEILGGAQ